MKNLPDWMQCEREPVVSRLTVQLPAYLQEQIEKIAQFHPHLKVSQVARMAIAAGLPCVQETFPPPKAAPKRASGIAPPKPVAAHLTKESETDDARKVSATQYRQ